MNYSEVFNKAWKYVWKHKVLWLFALFAGSLVGIGFGYPGNNPGRMFNYRLDSNDWFTRMPPFLQGRVPPMWQDIRSANPWVWVWVVIAAVVVILLITAICLFLSTAGRGGLIKGLLMAEDKGDGQKLKFKEVWQAMKPYFWRLLLLRLFVNVALVILTVILGILFVVITIVTLGLALCLLIPLILLAIPIGWLVKAVVANASIALVDEDLGVFKAIARSWEIVSNNVWSVLLVMFFNFLIGIGIVVAVLFPFVLVGAPFFLTGMFGGELSTGLWVLLGVLLFLAFIVTLFIGMWANTLVHGIFVVAYRRLKYQVSTPFGRTHLATTPSTSIVDDAIMSSEPAMPTGIEPASKEPDEASQES